MSLRVAVQMDPLDRINVAGDSTFAIMLKAQELGHVLYHYSPEALSYAAKGWPFNRLRHRRPTRRCR